MVSGDGTGSMTRFDLEDRLVAFAALVYRIAEGLPSGKFGHHIASQLFRSGTAPAASYGEAQSAESRKDFIHRMKISLKELRETRIWLKFLQRVEFGEAGVIEEAVREAHELISIFVASVATARRNDRRTK